MYRKSTLFGLLSLLALSFIKTSLATTYVNNGGSGTYSLNSGDSLSIAGGTFTGSITAFQTGAKISVASGAVFQPSNFSFPDPHGTLYVYGTFKMTSQLRTNTGFTLKNYGVVWVTSTTLMSGSSQLWTNYYGGLIKLDGDATMTNDNSIMNQGTITFGANFTMTGTSSVTNKNIITVAGNYLNSGGTFNNEGKFQTTGSITFNNGQAIINNYCRMIAESGINNTTGFVNNYGFMWAKASLGLGNLVNSGTITNGPDGIIKSVTLNNTGTIKGAGYLYFTGNTTTTNLGTTGVTGTTTDTIKFYDVSRTNNATIYDNQTGIVNPNTVYRVFAAPDSNAAYNTGCAIELISQIPLPINWNYFFVAMSENIPSLSWSAQYDRGTLFEVQRSYDGINFQSIKNLSAENSASTYTFNDKELNIQYTFVYYRIKSIEPSGMQKFSVTRILKLSSKPGIALQVAPNPFSNDFTISYQGKESGMFDIRIFNALGQEKMHKQIMMSSGFNSIPVTGVSGFSKGIYMVQVNQGDKLIAKEKLVKQ